jgi:hypothetical protein
VPRFIAFTTSRIRQRLVCPQRHPSFFALDDLAPQIEWVVLEDLLDFLGSHMVPRDVRPVTRDW